MEQEDGIMKTNKHLWLRGLAVACLAFGLQAMAFRASAGPPEANMVIETSAPGLARLEVLLTSKEWKEPRRFVFEGKDSIVGGIALPQQISREYLMTAFIRQRGLLRQGADSAGRRARQAAGHRAARGKGRGAGGIAESRAHRARGQALARIGK